MLFRPNYVLRTEFMGGSNCTFNWQPKGSSKICSIRFEDGSFITTKRRKYLKPGTIPKVKAAIEKVSRLIIKPIDGSAVDIRHVYLDHIPESDNTYDPRSFRSPAAPIKPWMAYFNLLRTVLGPGLLGMPVAVSASGLIVGNIITVIIAVTIVHTHFLLLLSLNEISKQLKIPYVSYRYGFRIALYHGPGIFHCIGEHGPVIVATFMFLSQLGLCTVNVIMTTDSLRDIADFQSIGPALLLLFPCYLFLEVFMKSLKSISYVSLFAAGLNMLGLIAILYHILKEPAKDITWGYEGNTVGGGLFTIGMCMFNFSAVGVILALDKSLKQPIAMTKKYGVINIGLGIPTVVSLIMGDLGYWAFGAMEENILRSLPYGDTSAMVAIALYMISMAMSYPLQSYPAIAMLSEVIQYSDWEVSPEQLRRIESFARPTFLIVSFIIAYYVPFQGPFVAFVGNCCATLMSVLFPAMMDLSLRYDVPGAYAKYKFHLIKDSLLIIISIICWVFGIYFCGYLIYVRILSSSSPNRIDF